MSQFDQSRAPRNVVANIVGKKIYLENMSSPMIGTAQGMGAFQMEIRSRGPDDWFRIERSGP